MALEAEGGKRGPRIVKLPYTVTLDDFVLKTYPGSDNPATYESFVSVDDPGLVHRAQAEGVSLREALTAEGLDPAAIDAALSPSRLRRLGGEDEEVKTS